MSVSGAEIQNRAFRPLVPGTKFIHYNSLEDLKKITTNTAAVILETIQGGAGFIEPQNDYLAKVKKQCEDVGALMIVDEIQTGIGRTGKFWGFENYKIVPDIIITGKGLGGGMPIGAFIAQKKLMDLLKDQPKLGHITTFGGHPVIASAAVATVNTIQNSTLIEETLEKEKLIRELLKHPKIKEIRGKGLMLAAIVETNEIAANIIHKCLEKGLILFFLLFEGKAIRITPPLTISKKEIIKGCEILIRVLNNLE
jgi:acetylornithine/succinyldiaminopimelate/putrescine aminotransferase